MNRTAAGISLAATGGVIFGSSATLAAFLTDSIDPFRLGALRVAIAGACLAPLAIAHRRRIRGATGGVVAIGVLQVLVNALLFVAIARIGVGPAIGLQFLAPLYVVAWDRITGAAIPRPVTWAGVVVAVAGVALVVQVTDTSGLDPLGVLAATAGGVGLAAYLRTGEHLGARIGPLPLVGGSMAVAGVIGVVISRPWALVGELTPTVAWGVVALGSVAMALPLALEMTSLTMVPARIVGITITIEPVAATLTAWWFLDQALSGSQWLGLVLIVGAVGAVSWTSAAPRPAPV